MKEIFMPKFLMIDGVVSGLKKSEQSICHLAFTVCILPVLIPAGSIKNQIDGI